MRITAIDVFPLNLPMLQNFSISGGQVGSKNAGAPHVYVRITTDDGTESWGEARPSHRWSYETLETVVSTIQNYFAEALTGMELVDLEEIHSVMDQQISSGITRGQPIAKAAIDMAVMDAIGKSSGQPLAHVWLSPQQRKIALFYLISVKNVEDAAEKARFAKDQGYTGVDVKIGLNPEKDIEIIRAVKEVIPEAYFRVDANQAYRLKEAMRLSKEMEKVGVNVFEQPLAAGDLLGHAKLRAFTTIPIALDESIWTPEDVVRAIQLEACDAIVIKVTKMSGPSRAKRCGEIAQAAGMELIGGGLTESSLGLYASAQLFHALGVSTPVDLNGPLFLADDPSKVRAEIEHGEVTLPSGFGIGWEVDPAKLARLSV